MTNQAQPLLWAARGFLLSLSQSVHKSAWIYSAYQSALKKLPLCFCTIGNAYSLRLIMCHCLGEVLNVGWCRCVCRCERNIGKYVFSYTNFSNWTLKMELACWISGHGTESIIICIIFTPDIPDPEIFIFQICLASPPLLCICPKWIASLMEISLTNGQSSGSKMLRNLQGENL